MKISNTSGTVIYAYIKVYRDFPGGPVVKILHFQCRSTSLIPGQGIKILNATWHGLKIKKQINKTKTTTTKTPKKKIKGAENASRYLNKH